MWLQQRLLAPGGLSQAKNERGRCGAARMQSPERRNSTRSNPWPSSVGAPLPTRPDAACPPRAPPARTWEEVQANVPIPQPAAPQDTGPPPLVLVISSAPSSSTSTLLSLSALWPLRMQCCGPRHGLHDFVLAGTKGPGGSLLFSVIVVLEASSGHSTAYSGSLDLFPGCTSSHRAIPYSYVCCSSFLWSWAFLQQLLYL